MKKIVKNYFMVPEKDLKSDKVKIIVTLYLIDKEPEKRKKCLKMLSLKPPLVV